MIQLNGQYQLSDYAAAQKLHARRGLLSGWVGYLIIVIFVFIAVGAVIWTLWDSSVWTLLLVAIVAILTWAFLRRRQGPGQLARVFAQQRELSLPFEMEFSDEALHFKNEYGNNRLPWQDFVKWQENQDLLLLYRSDYLFNMLPKRLFQNENEIEYIRERLRAHGVPDSSNVQKPLRLSLVAILVVVAIVVVVVSYWGQFAAK